jgi:DNA transformation protein and related proteins
LSVSAEFAEFLKDQLADFGPVSIRNMFGGAGVYRDGLMFALIADEVVYFKADDTNRRDFDAEGLGPFVYSTKTGQNIIMSYWRAPARCMDDPAEMAAWARKAYEAALRASKPRSAKRAKRPG